MNGLMEPLAPFSTRLIAWQMQHGRHHLPWQGTRDPYRVWLSEIMLQQTQVTAVVGYFDRFIRRFSDVHELARASQDEVLALWSGLGYYSRARNLHRCANIVCSEHAGIFPRTAQLLETLPGVGSSTAAAIASICFDERISIFDGNVQRVLSRYVGFESDLATAAARNALLAVAAKCLPALADACHMPTYTQALMDLGATLCTPRSPSCSRCPVSADCVAFARNTQLQLPVKTRKLRRQTKRLWWLVLRTQAGQVWLTKRPVSGVWASMYCFPEFESEVDARSALSSSISTHVTVLNAFKHVLTHLDLVIHPLLLDSFNPSLLELTDTGGWFAYPGHTADIGLPKPVSWLLEQMESL